MAAAETAVHEGDDNTPSGPTGRGVKRGLVAAISNFSKSSEHVNMVGNVNVKFE